MTQALVSEFTLHNDRGQSLLAAELTSWMLKMIKDGESEIFGPVISYSWLVNDTLYETQKPNGQSWKVLPDATGFIAFEQDWKPDNCLLLDAYGKERMRLVVPWELTGSTNPESAKAPTSFENVSEPYVNPADGKKGQFGVTAWVEHAGKYYFELDYHTGKFLWGKAIRD